MINHDDDKKGCGICKIPYFERNNFFYGKLMTVRDFFAEQCYFNEKRRLINKATIGSGVVCGLEVVKIDNDTTKVKVLPGMAIDNCGREIVVCEPQVIELKPGTDPCREQGHREQGHQGKDNHRYGEDKVQAYLVCIEYRECKTEPLPLPPISCDQKEQCEFNRIRDSFKIRVIDLPHKKQGDEHCGDEPFCPQTKDKDLHKYLCERLLTDCPDCPEHHCVILAEVTVAKESPAQSPRGQQLEHIHIEPREMFRIDNCKRRKFVYSNAILYDLIHCYHGDLPHIIGINWTHGDEMGWEEFKDMLWKDTDEDESYDKGLELEKKGLVVTFDRPIAPHTINRHTFLFAAIITDTATGYKLLRYIPPEHILVQTDHADGKTKATFIVERGWLGDELRGTHSAIGEGAEFQIILRGDHILEDKGDGKTGKALDGNFIGGKFPTGNGTQGGDFVSWFSVRPRGEDDKKKKHGPKRH